MSDIAVCAATLRGACRYSFTRQRLRQPGAKSTCVESTPAAEAVSALLRQPVASMCTFSCRPAARAHLPAQLLDCRHVYDAVVEVFRQLWHVPLQERPVNVHRVACELRLLVLRVLPYKLQHLHTTAATSKSRQRPTATATVGAQHMAT